VPLLGFAQIDVVGAVNQFGLAMERWASRTAAFRLFFTHQALLGIGFISRKAAFLASLLIWKNCTPHVRQRNIQPKMV
jgi:hypothetical protein